MHKWQNDFIEGLKQGKMPENLARTCAGLPLNAVQALRDEDPEFAMLWDEAVNYSFLTRQMEITPRDLERALTSQLSDKDIASYFMMSEEQFLERVFSDTVLKSVYDYGRDSAKVKLAVAQMDNALAGHADMQRWLGKQYLKQAEKVEHKNTTDPSNQAVTVTHLFLRTLTNDQLEALLEQGVLQDQSVIEGEVVSVEVGDG